MMSAMAFCPRQARSLCSLLFPHPLHPRPQRRLRTVIYLLFAKYAKSPADDAELPTLSRRILND
ncbi:MAG TPA: hypothetical protein V6D25_29235 [Leptolyngbyaceae cyanobacterium]